ncbi:hypothetical protein C2845_PM18G07370 [Panicum miliaceum]|uniref:Uncharacterized protein n=1 Tax=Panicum miliaceum TaxID=4540 RepID=A0A3L6PMD2_PANMI|nr:hypothetical protein C2845_PM18G07370 [Panicum miliaceum]
MRGPCHVRLNTPSRGSVPFVAIGMVSNAAPLPRSPSNRQATTAGRLHLVDKPAHMAAATMAGGQRMSLAPSSDDVSHRNSSSIAELPAAIRCKPGCPMLSLPQTLSSAHSRAALTTAKQRQPPWSAASGQPNKHAATSGRHHNCECHHVNLTTPRQTLPPAPSRRRRLQSPMAIDVAGIATSRVGSLETTSPRRARR